MTIVEFLLARLAHDERVLRGSIDVPIRRTI